QWSVRKTRASAEEQVRVMRLLRKAELSLEGRLEGPRITMRDLLKLEEGQLLVFDYSVQNPIELMVNGTNKYSADLVTTGRKRASQIEAIRYTPPPQGRIKEEPARSADSGPAVP